MTWVVAYLAVGAVNAALFALSKGFSSLPEVILFVIAWPIQVLFFVAMVIESVVAWLLGAQEHRSRPPRER